jgi:DHA1 family bicyclomycin/chloramphenicol resistance-like MFS transporter
MRTPTRPHATSIPVTVLLTALVALGPISTDLYLPSLPGMARDLNATVPEVQLTLSLFLAGLALGQLVYGPLSDRFGRRPVLLAGVVLYFIASLACVVAPSMTVLVVARFIQALGACAGPVLCRAVVRDVHGREGSARVLSYMAAAMALAPALGPIIGGFLEVAFGWRANFVALAVYGFAGLVAAVAILPETNRAPDIEAANPLRVLATYLGLMRQRVYLGYVLCAAFAYSTIFSFISGSPFVLVDMVGLAPDAYGFCFAAVVVGYIVGAVASGRLTRKLGIDRLIAVGGAVASSAGVVLLIVGWSGVAWHGVSGAIAIVLPQAVVMAGAGLVMSNAFAGAIGPFPRQAGAASALSGFLQMSVAALAGFAVGHFFDGTARAMTAAIALAGLLIPLTYRLLVRGGAKSDRADAG